MLRRRMTLAILGLALALVVVLSMSTCNLFGAATLTIRNWSSNDIDFVTWSSNNGVTYGFGNSWVWDTTTLANEWGLSAFGGSDTREVNFGSDFIYFFFTTSAIGYRTAATVDVNLFTDGSFSFYDGTLIYTATLRDGSTETRTYTFVPVPGLTKPTK